MNHTCPERMSGGQCVEHSQLKQIPCPAVENDQYLSGKSFISFWKNDSYFPGKIIRILLVNESYLPGKMIHVSWK